MIFKLRSGVLKKLQNTILLGSLNIKFNLNIKANKLNPMCDRGLRQNDIRSNVFFLV